jgi:hypothetical protein
MTVKSFIFIAALLTSNLIPSARCAPFPADQIDPAVTVYHNVNVLTKEDLEHGSPWTHYGQSYDNLMEQMKVGR